VLTSVESMAIPSIAFPGAPVAAAAVHVVPPSLERCADPLPSPTQTTLEFNGVVASAVMFAGNV